jgi:hypothetical protein
MKKTNQEPSLRDLRRQFAKRYYLWAISDAVSEAEQDFPFIRRIKSQSAYKFLEVANAVHRSERSGLLTALAKRFHKEGLAANSELITVQERNLITKFLSSTMTKLCRASE